MKNITLNSEQMKLMLVFGEHGLTVPDDGSKADCKRLTKMKLLRPVPLMVTGDGGKRSIRVAYELTCRGQNALSFIPSTARKAGA